MPPIVPADGWRASQCKIDQTQLPISGFATSDPRVLLQVIAESSSEMMASQGACKDICAFW